tara:strand:+ start:1874 stop:2170 length:297 start_codon:yes stop_codon:yes gene_type:complete
MRVKITRTVDVEEVPSVVEKIAADCRQLLQLQASRMNTAMHDIPKMVENLNHVLLDLALLQEKIRDMINIAVGWDGVVNPQPDAPATPPSAEEKDEQV